MVEYTDWLDETPELAIDLCDRLPDFGGPRPDADPSPPKKPSDPTNLSVSPPLGKTLPLLPLLRREPFDRLDLPVFSGVGYCDCAGVGNCDTAADAGISTGILPDSEPSSADDFQ